MGKINTKNLILIVSSLLLIIGIGIYYFNQPSSAQKDSISLKEYSEYFAVTIFNNDSKYYSDRNNRIKITPYIDENNNFVYTPYIYDDSSSATLNTFLQEQLITDPGYKYLLENIFPKVEWDNKYYSPELKEIDLNDYEDPITKEPDYVMSQLIIWAYYYTKYPEEDKNEYLNKIKETKYIFFQDDEVNVDIYGDLYDEVIKDLVDEALRQNEQPVIDPVVNVVNTDKNIAVTTDEEYYQTGAINISKSNIENYIDHEFIINGPKGTYLIDGDGNKIEGKTTATEVYARIPIDNVTDENKVVVLNMISYYETDELVTYVDSNGNSLISVKPVIKTLNSTINVPLLLKINVPDTNIFVSNSIYFIGAIFLLLGAGVIYLYERRKKKIKE